MSDLSRLLDDVYGTRDEVAAAEPEWASEEALDNVFADWVPGEPLEQSVVPVPEPELASEPEPEPENAFLDGDMFGAVALVPDVEVEPTPAPEAAPALELRAWVPSDDDILPARKRLRLSLRR
jgi:hypothetical protein